MNELQNIIDWIDAYEFENNILPHPNLIKKKMSLRIEEVEKLDLPDIMLLCPFCESTNTTVIEAVSDCECDDCGKAFTA